MNPDDLKILLIDDNPEDRKLAAHHLKREFDIEVVHIKDKDDLEEALDSGDFDIVITDYRSRWTDGLQVLDEVKSRYPDVNVIMFTGTGNEEIAVEGMRSGLDDYIIKSPGHFEHLPTSIRNIIEKEEQTVKRKQAEEREEFLHSLLRHDVRNKVQVIRGYIDLIKEEEVPKEIMSYLSKIDRAARESVDIMQKVSWLRKVKKEEIKPTRIDPLLYVVVEEIEEIADKNDIKIELEPIDVSCEVKGGPLLKEVFGNLIENSIKHSKGNNIWITEEDYGSELICRIEDDGKGIPGRYKDRIFEKGFKDGDGAGSGLGMFMVKKIVDLYDGGIDVKDSRADGARFDVYLKKFN